MNIACNLHKTCSPLVSILFLMFISCDKGGHLNNMVLLSQNQFFGFFMCCTVHHDVGNEFLPTERNYIGEIVALKYVCKQLISSYKKKKLNSSYIALTKPLLIRIQFDGSTNHLQLGVSSMYNFYILFPRKLISLRIYFYTQKVQNFVIQLFFGSEKFFFQHDSHRSIPLIYEKQVSLITVTYYLITISIVRIG